MKNRPLGVFSLILLLFWSLACSGMTWGEPGASAPETPAPERPRPALAPEPSERRLAGVDETFRIDNVSYRVDRVWFTPQLGSNQYSRRFAPDGFRYLVLYYSVHNDGAEAVPFSSTVRVLDPESGQAFAESRDVRAALQASAQRPVHLAKALPPGEWMEASTGFLLPITLDAPTVGFQHGTAEEVQFPVVP